MCRQLQCVVLCFVLFILYAIGEHIVEANSGINIVESNVSSCLLHLPEERIVSIVLDSACQLRKVIVLLIVYCLDCSICIL